MIKHKVRPLSNEEIRNAIQEYKRKLWAHIQERQDHQQNQGFISFLERNIEDLNVKLKQRIAA